MEVACPLAALKVHSKDTYQTGQMPSQSESLLCTHATLLVVVCHASYTAKPVLRGHPREGQIVAA